MAYLHMGLKVKNAKKESVNAKEIQRKLMAAEPDGDFIWEFAYPPFLKRDDGMRGQGKGL